MKFVVQASERIWISVLRATRMTAADKGRELFKHDPELMLAEVYRYAYKNFETHDECLMLVEAYVNARKQRWEREKD